MTEETKTLEQQLQEPFGRDEVKQRDGRGGNRFDYIDARSAHQRLDDVLGSGGWQTTYKVLDPDSKAVECSLSAFIDGHWVVKTDVGYPNSADDADHDEREPFKAAYSDAMKRAAVQFGIGRHLYAKTPVAPRQQPSRPPVPPASPAALMPFDVAELDRLLTEAGLVRANLIPVTGVGSNGGPRPQVWLNDHPGKTIADLVAEAKAKKS